MSMNWGPSHWIFFHSLAANITESGYAKIGTDLISVIRQICYNLPCPECTDHAKIFWSGVKIHLLKNKYNLIHLLYIFHNKVNERKKKGVFPFESLVKYHQVPVSHAFNVFSTKFLTTNEKLMSDNLHRRMILKNIKKWLMLNMHYFTFGIASPPTTPTSSSSPSPSSSKLTKEGGEKEKRSEKSEPISLGGSGTTGEELSFFSPSFVNVPVITKEGEEEKENESEETEIEMMIQEQLTKEEEKENDIQEILPQLQPTDFPDLSDIYTMTKEEKEKEMESSPLTSSPSSSHSPSPSFSVILEDPVLPAPAIVSPPVTEKKKRISKKKTQQIPTTTTN